MLDIHQLGFQFTIFAILGTFVYFTTKYLKLTDTLIVVFALSIIYSFILKKTTMLSQLGSFTFLCLYSFALFLVFALTFRLIWNSSIRYLRNLFFSILAAMGYTIVHIAVHLLLGKTLVGQFIVRYFTNAFVIMLTISTGFVLTEFIISKIEAMLKTPERIKPKEEEDDEEEE
jgi:signal transduction histidine kinase